MNYVILCDIDGVLADLTHRLHHQREKNYDAFYNAVEMSHDKPIKSGLATLQAFQHIASVVLMVTGRPEHTRQATINWLADQRVDYHDILMRKDGDHRKSGVVKVELIKKRMELDKKLGNKVEYIFIDDDPANILAVNKAYPNITCICFGAERLKEKK